MTNVNKCILNASIKSFIHALYLYLIHALYFCVILPYVLYVLINFDEPYFILKMPTLPEQSDISRVCNQNY